MSLRDRAGSVAGWLAAPVFAAVAAARHTRVFHPEGMVLAAAVEPIEVAVDDDVIAVGERLRGPAMVRFSTALWRRGKEWPDVLGCAVRFRTSEMPGADPEPGDQDLLLATVRSPFTLALGPFGTAVHDYLANIYFGTAPFEVRGFGRAKWRLVPEGATVEAPEGVDRRQRLLAAVEIGRASLRLDMRRTLRRAWFPVVRLRLEREVAVDQDRLRFWPFRDGRGITPRGFVHGLRRGAYGASQKAGRRPR